MFTLSLLARAFQAPPGPQGIDPLRHLMERANARSGHDAEELRAAAGAWLRVIR